MTDGGGGRASSSSPTSGGQFLLQLLQKPNQNQAPPSTSPPITTSITSSTLPPSFTVHPHPHHDPAVAVMCPTFPFPPWNTNGHDPHLPLRDPTSNPFPSNFLVPRFPSNPWGLPPPPNSHFPVNQPIFPEDLQRLGFLDSFSLNGESVHQQQKKQENVLMFGSFPCKLPNYEGLLNGNLSDHKMREVVEVSGSSNCSEIGCNSSQNSELDRRMNLHGPHQWNHVSRLEQGGGRGGGSEIRQQNVTFQSSPVPESVTVPPGFQQKPRGLGQWGSVSRRELEFNVDKEENDQEELKHRANPSNIKDVRRRREEPKFSRIQGDVSSRLELSGQLDRLGPPRGSNLHSVPALDIEESLVNLHGQFVKEGGRAELARQDNRNSDGAIGSTNRRGGRREQNDLAEQFMDSMKLRDGFDKKNDERQYNGSRDRDFRSDKSRVLWEPGQRMRNHRREVVCRSDISRLNVPLLAIYESLVPEEEEKAKQKQLLTSLEKLVNKEWPRAQLYLYGSCANSFGVSNSDIDVCLAIDDVDITKSELLLKLADILQSDNLENVQALTRARVPIVKLMDPVTGISCDICVNNVLAVVNTKLLRDYAQIDGRLRQLAFIVKHWAKSRGVNETYQGTLSSYAYVLMCIHFLQQRKPAILPCLQGMEASYAVTVDDIECAYFDQVEKLRDFGAQNKESIAQLVWAFFDYWAYGHDYANAVISVRTGSIISKRAKDWTRRIGNDRHLICIEDPFETSHDLGRVVDKYSIKVLREEFERAANILQFDPNPCVTLVEPFVPS